MKNFLIWLRWKLFEPIVCCTCMYIKDYCTLDEYKDFLISNGGIKDRGGGYILPLDETHPKSYKQMRRDFMYRFLVKGER